MGESEELTTADASVETLRDIVQSDYERIEGADSPYEVLNVRKAEASLEVIEAKRERYSAFYDAEKFNSVDTKLAEKAQFIRTSVEQAFVDLKDSHQKQQREATGDDAVSQPEQLPELSPHEVELEQEVMASTYCDDGKTYRALGILDRAIEHFERAFSYAPSNIENEAHWLVSRYQANPLSKDLERDSREILETAIDDQPENEDLLRLAIHFHLTAGERDRARSYWESLDDLDDDPMAFDRWDDRVQTLSL